MSAIETQTVKSNNAQLPPVMFQGQQGERSEPQGKLSEPVVSKATVQTAADMLLNYVNDLFNCPVVSCSNAVPGTKNTVPEDKPRQETETDFQDDTFELL